MEYVNDEDQRKVVRTAVTTEKNLRENLEEEGEDGVFGISPEPMRKFAYSNSTI